MKLFYFPGSASMAPHCVLEELGQPFQLALIDRDRQAHKSADYLRLNPNGLIPVLCDGDLVLYEAAAICLYLADKYPDQGLAPALGTVQRAELYKWLMWATNTLQSTLLAYFYPQRWVDEGNAAGAQQVKTHAEIKVAGLLQQLEDHLQQASGPWFLGQHYSVLDPYLLTTCRWTRMQTKPARDFPALGDYLSRVLERPATQRALKNEGLSEPWV